MSVVIGFRDKKNQFAMLAADRMVTFSHYDMRVLGSQQKSNISRRHDYALGGVGDIKFVTRAIHNIINSDLTAKILDDRGSFFEWLKQNDELICDVDNEDSGEILIITKSNIVFINSSAACVYVDDDFFAIGSGAQVSLGALKMSTLFWPEGITEQNDAERLHFYHSILNDVLQTVSYFVPSVSDPFVNARSGDYARDIIVIKGDLDGKEIKKPAKPTRKRK